MTPENTPPKWAKEIEQFLGVKSQFALWGNINDVYAYPGGGGGGVKPCSLCEYLKNLLVDCGYGKISLYEPFELKVLADLPGESLGGQEPEKKTLTLKPLADYAEQLVYDRDHSSALIINYASRLELLAQPDFDEFCYRLFRLSLESQPFQGRFNLIFWLLDKENDLPPWYCLDNPRVRVLSLPKPDHAARRAFAGVLMPLWPETSDISGNDRKEVLDLFVDQTGGLFAGEIMSIARMARQAQMPLSDIGEAVRRYKLGVPDNPWRQLGSTAIARAEEFLNGRVIGQTAAVTRAADIIKRSSFDLSGAQFSPHSQRPKGVMFLAGPTGVGKTELAKSLAELIFGSPANYIRFDMSEFAHDHADQRLMGAPPGYVGYDVGGELTNAVKQNPFSLLLFDEIEKGHPKILDIFLQILDDGRLSSGRGETVYFSETLIIFTSNLGVDKAAGGKNLGPDQPYEEFAGVVRNAISEFFKYDLKRPEILNRLGNNIVVFDFIRPEAAWLIFKKMFNNILYKLKESHDISIKMTDKNKKRLAGIVCHDLSMGGRGIGNALEDSFINPLSRQLLTFKAQPGQLFEASIDEGSGELSLNLVVNA